MMPHLGVLPQLRFFKVQQEMRNALKSANNNVERVPNGGSCSLSTKALDQNHYKSSKDPEISALIWRNTDQGYFILTFVSLEADHWKFVAPHLPLQGSEHRNQPGPGGHANMDRLLVVSPPPTVSLPVDPQKAQGTHSSDHTYSSKSLLARDLFQSTDHVQSRSRRLLNRHTKLSKFSDNSQKSSLFINSSTLIDDGASTACSADLVKDKRKADKPVKRNSKKKAKKRGKQSKKPVSHDGSPTGAEDICEESICQSSLSKACGNGDLAWDKRSISDDKSVENAMPHEGSLHDLIMDRFDIEKNNSCSMYHSEISSTAISYSSVEEESEAVMPVPESPVSEETGSNEIQPISEVLSTLNREVTDKQQRKSSYSNDIPSERLDGHNASLLDLISDGWSSDASVNAGVNIEETSTIKENNGIDFTGHSGNDDSSDGLGKRYLFQENIADGIVNSDNQAERTKCGSQGCSSSDFQMVLYGKRGRQGKKLFGNPASMNKFGSGANVHGHSGKENNLSVWQKVQKNDIDERGCKSNNAPPNSLVKSDGILKSNGNNKSRVKISEKMKWKPPAGSKQAYTYSRKRPSSCKSNSSGGIRTNIQLKEASEKTSEVNHYKRSQAGSRSHCYIDSPEGGSDQFCRVDNSLSESIHSSEVPFDDTKPINCLSPKVCDMDGQVGSTQNSLSSGSAKLLDQKQLLEEHSDVGLYAPIDNGSAKSQTEASNTEIGKQDYHSGSVLQKWIPVVRKDAEMLVTIGSSNLLAPHQGEPASSEPKIFDEEELSSSAHSFVTLADAEVGAVVSSLDVSCPAPKGEAEIENVLCDNSYEIHKPNGVNAVPNRILTCEPKDGYSCISEIMPSKMTKAIKGSLKMQLVAEGVHLASGRPLAEFERLLHSAAPVLGPAHGIGKCHSFSHNQLVDASLCLHEKPNLSLGSLWQWYERHGSYGLEVKAEDYQSLKRVGPVLPEFRAYFVPFLSAVQLFGNSRNCSKTNLKVIPSIDALEACDVDYALGNFADNCDLPIKNQTSQPQTSLSSSEFFPASGQEGCSCPSPSTTCFDDLELLFEFFESVQPQHRPPLFEKIKELVRGGGTSNSQVYGDPSILDFLSLHDLHPASWYSVAWYPIYRIPDGNFRAAFLTYHSLGHLIHRSTSSDFSDVDNLIVSPVVGLQSYNAQSEGWFQPKQNLITQPEHETSSFNHLDLLKKRIRALEEAADVMARGVVRKGSQRCRNRHPDYEFFLSRRRW